MAAIAKRAAGPSLATAIPPQNEQVPGIRAGEAIAGGDLCVINAQGLAVKRTNQTFGILVAAETGASVGEAITLYRNVRFGYGSGLTPGIQVFASDTVAGGLDTAGTVAVGFVVDAERIQFTGL